MDVVGVQLLVRGTGGPPAGGLRRRTECIVRREEARVGLNFIQRGLDPRSSLHRLHRLLQARGCQIRAVRCLALIPSRCDATCCCSAEQTPQTYMQTTAGHLARLAVDTMDKTCTGMSVNARKGSRHNQASPPLCGSCRRESGACRPRHCAQHATQRRHTLHELPTFVE